MFDPTKTIPLALVVSLGAFSPANAQLKSEPGQPDHTAQPLFGTVIGRAGSFVESLEVEIEAGGPNFIRVSGGICDGAINSTQPDVVVDYRPGDDPASLLNFMVVASVDTTLIVREPNGAWLCDDDSGNNANPLVNINGPRRGRYAIWAATFDGGIADALLFITEDGFPSAAGIAIPDENGEAKAGTVSLGNPDLTNPLRFDTMAGGPDLMPDFLAAADGADCLGYIDASRPTLHIENEEAGTVIDIAVVSDADTVLAVKSPDGVWFCNDDSPNSEDSNPQITIDDAATGRFSVWVGTFGEGPPAPAIMSVAWVAISAEQNTTEP